MRIQGPVFAITTPFDSEGEVDYGALDASLEFLAHHGASNLVVNGTTGEFASMTIRERMQVLARCRTRFAGTIVNHVSSSSYRACWALLDHAKDHADGVLLLPPYYYADIDEAGCLAFMRAVVARASLPVYLYNFPEHTQFEISPEMLHRLSGEFEHLAGIKDSGGKLRLSEAYKAAAPNLQVFVGGDRCALQVLRTGLDGSVTGAGNPVPELLVNVQTQFLSGDEGAANRAQDRFDQWTTFREGLPLKILPLIKAGLTARIPGFPPHVRPPFVTADDASMERIRSTLTGKILAAP